MIFPYFPWLWYNKRVHWHHPSPFEWSSARPSRSHAVFAPCVEQRFSERSCSGAWCRFMSIQSSTAGSWHTRKSLFNIEVKVADVIWCVYSLVGGFKHEWIMFHFIWDVIRNPLTNSIIFQDGEIAPPPTSSTWDMVSLTIAMAYETIWNYMKL